MGLPFILYLAWLIKKIFSLQKAGFTLETLLVAAFPPAYLLFIFLVVDLNGGSNLNRRGMIPAQILIVLAALAFLESINQDVWSTVWRKIILLVFFACFFFAQTLSSLVEVASNTFTPLRSVIDSNYGLHLADVGN